MSLSKRFYRSEFPEADDLVVVKVKEVTDCIAFCHLLEYAEKEAMINSSDVSRKRVRNLKRFLRPNEIHVMQVSEVDEDKNSVVLTKKYVKEEEREETMDWFAKSKSVQSIIQYISKKCEVIFEKLQEELVWPLYEEYDHAIEGFKKFKKHPEILRSYNIPEEVFDHLIREIKNRYREKAVKTVCEIDVNCFGIDGIDAIKSALIKGRDLDKDISITLQSTPTYHITVTNKTKEEGLKLAEKCMAQIKESLSEYKGGMAEIKMEPRTM